MFHLEKGRERQSRHVASNKLTLLTNYHQKRFDNNVSYRNIIDLLDQLFIF